MQNSHKKFTVHCKFEALLANQLSSLHRSDQSGCLKSFKIVSVGTAERRRHVIKGNGRRRLRVT